MEKNQAIAINDAVYKLQLAMLEGITDLNQLFAVGKLMSRSDYEDVVTERTIAKLCGYPLCRRFLPADVSRRGKYRISLKQHKVYDLQETRKFCSAGCLIDSRAFSGTLHEARTSEFDTVKLNEILGLFDDSDVKEFLDVKEDLGLSKLTIRENVGVRDGELSLEQWMGPSNAVEGYIPFDRSDCKSRNDKHESKATQSNQEKHEDHKPSKIDFTSTVIISDAFSISKLPPQNKQTSPVKESEGGEGKAVLQEQTVVPSTKKSSRFRRQKERDRKTLEVDGMGCASSVTTNTAHNVENSASKQSLCSLEDPMVGQFKDNIKISNEKSSLTTSSSASKKLDLGLPTLAKQASDARKSEEGKGEPVRTNFEQTAVLRGKKLSSSKALELEYMKNFGFDEMGCENSAITGYGHSVDYSVSKQPSCSTEDPRSCHLRGVQTLDEKNFLLGSSSASNTKGSRSKSTRFGHAKSCDTSQQILRAELNKGLKAQGGCSSGEPVAKSCLKVSGSKKVNHSVTWADQNGGHGDLCEVKDNNIAADIELSSTGTEDVNSESRLALAEACAIALSQAAEDVSSGDSNASDAAAKAGIILLPSTHQLDDEHYEKHINVDIAEEEPTLLKWPNKPGIPDSDLFDRDQSWIDGTPEGFSLTLSSFAVMWDLLFGWVSTSSLAYIYGKDESAHEEFMSVNGKEYPRRIVMGDGLSSEIKETIAGHLARALPRVATDLRLPIAISELEKGLGSLLGTMSLTGAIPSLRGEQWLLIVLLFLEALSVSRIPRIAPYISNRNKILEGSGIGSEEYEIMKDILLPLGRVAQFATRSGA